MASIKNRARNNAAAMASTMESPRSRTSPAGQQSDSRRRDFRSQSASYASPFSLPTLTKKGGRRGKSQSPRKGGGSPNKSMQRSNSVTRNVIPGALSPTKVHNLPMGSTMNHLIKERAPRIWKNARKETKSDATWLEPSDSTLREQKDHGRRQDALVKKWAADKATKRKEQIKVAEEERSAKSDRFAGRETDSLAAYQKWLDKKENDSIAQREAEIQGPKPPRGFSISEVRNAVQQNIRDDALFDLMDKLSLALSAADKQGMIDPEDVQVILAQAHADRLVQAKLAKLKKQSENDTRDKEAVALERVQLKVANQILEVLQTGRTVFGSVVQTIKDVFNVADINGDGALSKEEFKFVCDRLDLGLNVQTLQDFWGTMDLDASGDITADEFEQVLILAEATKFLYDEKPDPAETVALCSAIQEDLGEDETYDLFVKIFEAAFTNRLNNSIANGGTIGFWEYRALIRKIETVALEADQRACLLRIMNKLFRKLDRKKTDAVKLDDITFFIRKVMMAVQEEAKKGKVDKKSAAENMVYRVGKCILKNVAENMPGESKKDVVNITVEVFKDSHPEGHHGVIGKSHLMGIIREFGFSLSMVQEDVLFNGIDIDGNGSIEVSEFLHFLKHTQEKLNQEEQNEREAQDPRNNILLTNAIMRGVSSVPEEIVPILLSMKELFTVHGTKMRESKMEMIAPKLTVE